MCEIEIVVCVCVRRVCVCTCVCVECVPGEASFATTLSPPSYPGAACLPVNMAI